MDNKFFCAAILMAGTAFTAGARPLGESTGHAAVAKTDSSHVVDLDEVVVVAQPKESATLRRQPLSSTVFTENELDRLNIRDLSRLSYHVPSFVVPAYGSRYTSSFYVRGIGSRSGDPAMGVYYDNVPLVNKATYNRHFYQLDRIDVLRGPQGTLYGINTEGGVVKIYTKNPMAYQGSDIRMGIGTGLYSNIEAAHYHRPSERFAFSSAVFYSGLGGFFDNTNLGKKADLTNEAGGRMRFMLKPTERFTADLTADYQYVNQNAFPYGEYKADGSFADPSTTIMNGYKRQMVTAGLNLSYAAPRLLISSVTSYQYLKDLMQMDQDYLPTDYMRLEQRQKMNAVTQELSLRSHNLSAWQHASGVFFSYQWLRTSAPVYFGDAMNEQIKGSMLGAIMSNNRIPQTVKDMLNGCTFTDNYVPGTFKTPALNLGLYHETNLKLTSRLTATVGLRYDYQHLKIDYDTYSQFLFNYSLSAGGHTVAKSNRFSSLLQGSDSKEYNQLLPKFALMYKLNGGNNVYATVSKGFRAGGYNLQMFADIFKTEQSALGSSLMQLAQGDYTLAHTETDYSNVNRTISYEPEVSWNYEAGAHLNLFSGKVKMDFAAFYMRITNQQLSILAGNYGYGRMMVNAGRSGSLGVELAVRGTAFADRLSWAATYSCTRSTFRDYTDSVRVGETYEAQSYRGKRVPFVPMHTFSAMADYRFNLPQCKTLRAVTLGANVAGNGNTYWDSENLYSQKLYAILGAHVALDFGAVRVDLWGRNLTNTKYNTFLVNSSADRTTRSFAQRGNPIQAGVDVSLHF